MRAGVPELRATLVTRADLRARAPWAGVAAVAEPEAPQRVGAPSSGAAVREGTPVLAAQLERRELAACPARDVVACPTRESVASPALAVQPALAGRRGPQASRAFCLSRSDLFQVAAVVPP
jgi:hypothetical protein